ncbi:MAG: DUF937 domain-containing protein [Pseudomonadota bacterium]
MGIFDMILKEIGGSGLAQVARKAGISEQDLTNVFSRLVPSVTQGIKNNASDPAGAQQLLNALENGNHQRYLDKPESLDQPETIEDGNAILGHIFGSKDISRSVAGQTANETGVDEGIVKKILPIVASVAMGALSKQASGSGLHAAQLQGGSGSDSMMGLLGSFLDADKDGDVTDDLLDMAKKLF